MAVYSEWLEVADERRPVDEIEAAAIGAMLSVGFDGVEALREQVSAISSVTSGCECGCGTVSLFVDTQSAPASTFKESRAPVEALFRLEEDGVAHSGGLMLWIIDGWLAQLEVFSSTERGAPVPRTADLAVYHRNDPSNPVEYHD